MPSFTGNKSLLKWKGVVFSPEEEAELERVEKATPEAGTSCATTAGTNPAPTAEKNKDLKDFPSNANGHKVNFVFFAINIFSHVFAFRPSHCFDMFTIFHYVGRHSADDVRILCILFGYRHSVMWERVY